MRKNFLPVIIIGVVTIAIVIILAVVLISNSGKEPPTIVTDDFSNDLAIKGVNKLYKNFDTNKIEKCTIEEAYNRVVDGKADIAFVLGDPETVAGGSDNQDAALEKIAVAKEALVLFNSKKNPVSDISKSQFDSIYSGEITNWKDLGGDDLEINAYHQEIYSDAYVELLNFVSKSKLAIPKIRLRDPSFQGVVKAVGEYLDTRKKALGYSTYYDIKNNEKSDNINILIINGAVPNDESIKNGTYPLTVNIYAIMRKDLEKNSQARKLVKYILSEKGQTAIADKYIGIK